MLFRRVVRLAFALAAASLLVVGVAGAASASPVPATAAVTAHPSAALSDLPPRVTFVSRNSPFICVGIQNQGGNVGQRAVGTQCIAEHSDQIWDVQASGQLVTERTGMCLDTATSTNHGTGPNVVQWICDSSAVSQIWVPFTNPDGSTLLRNAESGQCLTMTSFSSGHNLMMKVCNFPGEGALQEFTVLPR